MSEELREDLRSLVDAWVDETEPGEAALSAGHAEVSKKLALGERSPLAASPAGSGWLWGAGAVAVAGVAAALLWPRPADAPAPEPAPVAAALAAEEEEVVEPEAAQAQPAQSMQPEEVEVESKPPKRAAVRKNVNVRKKSVAPAQDVDTLAAELALLRTARGALRSGRHQAALSAVAEHRASFPNSAFAEERAATEVMALCGLGRAEQARGKAERFKTLYPSSTFASGLLDRCPKKEAGP